MSDAPVNPASPPQRPADFIREIVSEDTRTGRWDGQIVTRFPPEPNGYLHIGHAKSICLNFGIAREFGGRCHLRYDDTNPTKEEAEYVESIREDVRWLGWDWGAHEYYASDTFEKLYEFAVNLIKAGKAYVCDLSGEEVRRMRGDLRSPGLPSPYRDRTVEENLELFAAMRAGKYPDGSHTLRAKIDMASPNLNMRDPVMYRILHARHHRTGSAWPIYPMYDFAHGQCDSLEGITHSICTLEFEDHRPLYDWFCENLAIHHPRQIEFARLNLTYTVLSKRKLLQLVREGHVSGWDDPRMPTIRGLRRRGYPPTAIRAFCDRIGVAKRDSVVDLALLEFFVREELNRNASRAMCVLRPLRVIIENLPQDHFEELDAVNHPDNADAGARKLPFSREIFIERDDFMEEPPSKFYRLAPGREVRLRWAYFLRCTGVDKDPVTGEVTALRAEIDPLTRGGNTPPDGRKVKATIHWVSASHAVDTEVRLYDNLFLKEDPDDVEEGQSFLDGLNPNSLEVLRGCKAEPSLDAMEPGKGVQFERLGYFCADTRDAKPGAPVFNRTVGLRDTWAKSQKKS